jgi:hypothetical protein
MSNSICLPKISKSTIDNLEIKFGKDLKHMIDDLTPLTESCPMKSSTGGKRRRTKRKGSTRKSQKGGDSISALTFKRIINALIVVLMAYMTMSGSAAMVGIVAGVTALLNGECGSMSNYLWESLGFGNPICLAYNRLMLTIMRAISLDGMAIAQLGSILTIVLAAPYTLLAGSHVITYQLARLVPNQILSREQLDVLRRDALGGRAQIEARATPQQMEQIAAIFDDGSSQAQIGNSDSQPQIGNSDSTSNDDENDAISGLMSMKNDNQNDEDDAIAGLMSMKNARGGKRRKRKTMTKRKQKKSGKKGKKGNKSRKYKR